ncbi:hypothetical protein AAHC03_0121 [Spirometra sp. Aus1]
MRLDSSADFSRTPRRMQSTGAPTFVREIPAPYNPRPSPSRPLGQSALQPTAACAPNAATVFMADTTTAPIPPQPPAKQGVESDACLRREDVGDVCQLAADIDQRKRHARTGHLLL